MKKPEACLATLRKIRFQVNTERIGSKKRTKMGAVINSLVKRNRREFACILLNVVALIAGSCSLNQPT